MEHYSNNDDADSKNNYDDDNSNNDINHNNDIAETWQEFFYYKCLKTCIETWYRRKATQAQNFLATKIYASN